MFDPNAIEAALRLCPEVVRVVIISVAGSSPREVGASMIVWPDGQSGTIGGGALEFEAARTARDLLSGAGPDLLETQALGPSLGQCCGGSVQLLYERFDQARLERTQNAQTVSRPLPKAGRDKPLGISRIETNARNQGAATVAQIIDGWFIEPVAAPTCKLWIWGAGHVGRAMVDVMSPLPGVAITWVDIASDRFPDHVPTTVNQLWAPDPARLMTHAPVDARHLILTYSHTLDLELCHQVLMHGFRDAGLIGSDTKWARFKNRLAQLGHSGDQIARITCPIGDPALGKHPHAIATGVAAALLADMNRLSIDLKKECPA